MAKKKTIRSCRNKKSYESWETAQSRATSLYKKGLTLKPYRCPVCGCWHLTKINWRTRLDMAFAEAGMSKIFSN